MPTTDNPRFEGFNLVGFIMEYEGGELDEETLIEGFQHLIDTGYAWTLQGHYGRTAQALIDAGLCTYPETPAERYAAKTRMPLANESKVGTYCECGAPYDAE